MGRVYLVKNSAGEVIKLNRMEQAIADILQEQNQKLFNSLGFEIPITTLTTVIKKVQEQRFFQLPPDDYVPIRTGEGAWSTGLTTFREYALGGSFEEGIINTANQNDKLASADTGVDAVNVPIVDWAKQVTYTLFEINFAAKNNNWDLIEARQRARKKNWDLGIQDLAFMGVPSLANSTSKMYGLLNQPSVALDNTVLHKPISQMTTDELSQVVGNMITKYRNNNQHTVYPNRLVIPESDWNALANPASPTFPNISRIDLLEQQFKRVTRNPDFKILPAAYADVNGTSDISVTVPTYALYNYDQDSLRLDLPVDYTTTVQNSINNFQFQNVGYGQISGVYAYRPLEMMYFVITT